MEIIAKTCILHCVFFHSLIPCSKQEMQPKNKVHNEEKYKRLSHSNARFPGKCLKHDNCLVKLFL